MQTGVVCAYIYARDGTTGIRPTICRPARAQQHAARTLRTTAFGGRRRRRAPMPERLASSGHRRRRRARVLPAGSGGVPLLEQKHVRHQQLSPSPHAAPRRPGSSPGPSRRQALRMISLCCLLCFPPSHSLSLSRSLNIVRSIFFLRKEPFQKEDERDMMCRNQSLAHGTNFLRNRTRSSSLQCTRCAARTLVRQTYS
jgi:hypothetical protein